MRLKSDVESISTSETAARHGNCNGGKNLGSSRHSFSKFSSSRLMVASEMLLSFPSSIIVNMSVRLSKAELMPGIAMEDGSQ